MTDTGPSKNDWEIVRKVAHRGYLDGIDTLACIEILERGNSPEVIEQIIAAGAAKAADLIRKSLLDRMHMNFMRAYDPVRKGDNHLRVAFEILRKPGGLDLAPTKRQRSDLTKALKLWNDAEADPRLKTLRHLRNKFVAHLSEPNKQIPIPKIRELFGFAKKTCEIWERLSFGTGVVMIELSHQTEAYSESADAFWAAWNPIPRKP